jgi:lysophospholipase L1-like esterase
MTELRVCFFGDNFIAGIGDEQFRGWPTRLAEIECARGHDVTAYGLGVRRNSSKDVAARWEFEARRRLPENVKGGLVFSFGHNDVALDEGGAMRVGLNESLAAARSIFRTARVWRPTLWIGPTPIDPERAAKRRATMPGPHPHIDNVRTAVLSTHFASLAREFNVPYLDLFGPLSRDQRWTDMLRVGDGIHPNADGYRMLAELVQAWGPWRDWLE